MPSVQPPLDRETARREQATSTSRIIPVREAWPLLQERFDKVKNKDGRFELLSPKNQAVVDRQTAPSDRQAAVLLLLVTSGEPSVLFTRRTAHLSQHAAEISFPGGHREEQDASLVETAVREAVEELYPYKSNSKEHAAQVRAFRDGMDVLGTATPLPSIRGVPVTPVLAALRDYNFKSPITQTFPGDGGVEVDLVFSVPLAELVASETVHTIPATRFNFSNNKYLLR